MTTTTLDFKNALAFKKAKPVVSTKLGRQIFFVILGLLLFGLVEVFSASRYQGIELRNNPYYFGSLHLFYVLLTLASIGLFQVLPKSLWKSLTWISFFVLLATLVAVFFFPAQNGAHRWIPLGIFTLQPSELAKIGVVMVGALLFSKVKWDQDKSIWEHLIRLSMISVPVIVVMILVLVQPDLGNILVIGASFVAMYLSIPQKWRKLSVFLIVPLIVLLISSAILITPYRRERVMTYLQFMRTGVIEDEFGKGLQTRNILIGVGSGGFWGKGIGGSQLKHGYFVEVTAFTDSIAALIFEELGFFLGSLFVGVYVYLFYLLVRVAEAQQNPYNRLIMWGIAMWFITQTFIHFAANVVLIPVKGTTLPFVSYGGSSMLAFGLASGIAIKLARDPS
ncbi:MAG: FtsW/RodA/SpoVE family cell cycle protein [Patescibacteria group bacterium]